MKDSCVSNKKKVQFSKNPFVYRYIVWPADFKFERSDKNLSQMDIVYDLKDDFYDTILQRADRENCRHNFLMVILSVILFFVIMWWIANRMLVKEIEKQMSECAYETLTMFAKLLA